MLTQSQFDILHVIAENRQDYKQEQNISILTDLCDRNLISNINSTYKITEQGLKALEPYKVKNAIIMAAGMSSRFAPLSYEKPKGLLKVKGEILVEREIKQLQEAGITDITIVVGYLKEKFFYLKEKFNVNIVVNEDFDRFNNTSTLIRVTDKLSNTYICSSDNYFIENVFDKYVYKSYYSTVFTPDETDEWCVESDAEDKIKSVKVGGKNSWYMLGHVYWDKTFSDKFVSILKREYEKQETKESLWETLYIKYIEELDLYAKHYDSQKIKEFDSLEELRCFDSEYINNADSYILRDICKQLNCEMKEITNIKAIKDGIACAAFNFAVNNKNYICKLPDLKTENNDTFNINIEEV